MNWKNIVSTVAPWIGTAIGGPLGGMALSAVSEALGLSEATEDAVRKAIVGASPGDLLALKNADQAFSVRMQELGFTHIEKLEQIALDDRKSARDREIAVKDRTPAALAFFVTLGFFAVLAVMLYAPIPKDGEQALYIMLGSLGTAWTGIVAYYFGSSAGSAAKSELLAKQK